jgi:putative inorganic carbon (hco3(-)) transporter
MAQIPLQGLWETSVLGRLMNFAMDAWTDSLIGRALAQTGAAGGRVFADSFPGRFWYSDWPEPRHFAESRAGQALNGLGAMFARVGRGTGAWLNGLWDTSLLAGAGRGVVGAVAPLLGTSLFFQAYTGFAGDVALAPGECGRRPTSPLVLLLGTVLGILPLIPTEFSPSPTVLTILGVWGLALIWIVRKLMTGDFRWRGSAAFVPLGFLLVIIATATVQSISPGISVLNLIIWLTAALIFWMTVDLVRNSRDAATLLGPVLAGGAVLGVWAVYHQIHPPVVLESWTDPTTSGTLVRSFASMGNPNYLAEYMVLYLPLGFALWLQNQKRQIELAAPLVLMAIALLLTWSRGGWLAFALAIAVIVVMRFARWTIFGVLGALLFPLVAPQSILRRLASAFTTQDTSNAYRLNVWKGVEAMLHKYWALGTGPGAEVFAKGYEEFMLAAARAAHAHNTFLQVFAELGILGLIALLWLLVVVVRRTFVAGVQAGSSYLIAAVPAAMVGIFFQGLVEYIWYNPKLLFAFWAVAGLGVGVALGDREDAKA